MYHRILDVPVRPYDELLELLPVVVRVIQQIVLVHELEHLNQILNLLIVFETVVVVRVGRFAPGAYGLRLGQPDAIEAHPF